jgi:hypothetical protein
LDNNEQDLLTPLFVSNLSLFVIRAGQLFSDPSKHGFWETSCGELYVFGKSIVSYNSEGIYILKLFETHKANWEQNMAKCCSLGMTPISIDTKEKSMCFNKFINGFE